MFARAYGAAFEYPVFDCQSTPSNAPFPLGNREANPIFCKGWVRHWVAHTRAFGSGPGGRWFKSTRPDHFIPLKFSNFMLLSLKRT